MEPKNELQRNAITTARRKELESYQMALDRQWLDSRMADGGMSRCLALIKREAEMEKDFRERTDHAAIVNKRAEEETALGCKVAELERDKINLLQRRHYLRERDPELRELTKKLEAGYVCRDLKQQILQNEYRRLQDKVEEFNAMSELRNSLANNKEAEEQYELEKLASTSQYNKDLQQQLVSRQRQRQCQYEDTLIEKKMLDEIMRTISDEDRRELEQKNEQTEKLRREMVTSQAARQAWKQKQKELVILEEKKIEEQARAAADRSEAVIAERERKLRAKEQLNEIVCAKILADEAAKQERADIITLLQQQEYLEKNANDDTSEREKLEQSKRETKDALTTQMETRRQAARDERERDAALRAQNEAKFREDDEKERNKVAAVRQKNMKYCEELKQQIKDNAARRQRDKEDEEARAKHVFSTEDAWKQEVYKERKEIIKVHAPPILGYVQAGVLKPEDLATVREGANKDPKLANMDIESIGKANRPQRFAKCNPQCMVIRKY